MRNPYKIAEWIIVTTTILAAVAFTVFIVIVRANNSPRMMSIDARATKEAAKAEETEDLKQRNIFFSGIEDTTIKKGSLITLENLPENGDFLMRYKIFEKNSNTLLFETDLIPAGEHVFWDPSVNFGEGVHTVAFLAEPFFETDGEYMPLTCAKNIVNIEIREE